MREFILSNQAGSNLQNAVENPSMQHSIIRVRNPDGTEQEPIPWTPLTHHMYKPKPDPRYKKPHKIITTTGEIDIPPQISENEINLGENPFIQIIYRFVSKGAEREDIIRHLTKEKKVLPDNNYGITRAEKYIDEMHKGKILGGLILIHNGLYFQGVKIKTKRRTTNLNKGYDPFEYEIINYVDRKGTTSRDEIHRYIKDVLGWARYTKTVDYYINKLVKQKNLKKIRKDWFEIQHYLDSF